jgi:predicted neuraminidase
MLIRAQNTDPVLYRSDSRDFGRTWTAPRPTAIPAPATKVYLLRIEDRIVLLHNPNPKARTPLALWVSRDRGETWEPKLDLITARDGRRAICYPHAFADPDRELLYVASDAVQEFFLQKIPFADFL